MAYLYTEYRYIEYRLYVYLLNNAARLPDSTAFPLSIHFICILFITSIHRMGLYCQAESVEQRTRLRMQKRGLKIHCLFRGNLSQKRTGTHPVLFLRRRLPGWGSGDGEVRQTGAAVVLTRPRAGRRSRRRQPKQPQSRCACLPVVQKKRAMLFIRMIQMRLNKSAGTAAQAGEPRFFQILRADFPVNWFGNSPKQCRGHPAAHAAAKRLMHLYTH